MSGEINYKFLKMLETIDRDIASAVEYTEYHSVDLERVKRNYQSLQSEWERLCDYADNNRISTPLYLELIEKIRDNLGRLYDFVASSSSNQKTTIGNVSNSTIIIGNNNNAKNKK